MSTEIRFLEKKDENELQIFYVHLFGKNHILNNPVHHNWQFNNPFSTTYKSIAIAKNNDKIISHNGMAPYIIKVFDKKLHGVFHMSYYTLEEFRGKGYGSKLLQLSFSKFDSILGLSITEPSQKAHLKFGGKYFGNINRFIKILNEKRMETFLGKKFSSLNSISKKSKCDFKRIKNLDKNYIHFWNSVKSRYPITVERTEDYLNWRYLNHPLIDYHFMVLTENNIIVGYAILRFENKNDELKAIRIIDLIVYEEFELDLLWKILDYCKKYDADFIDFYCTGKFYSKTFDEFGFFNNLEKQYLIPTVFNPINKERNSINFYFYVRCKPEDQEKYYDQSNLFFVKGDSDQDRAY